MKKRLYAGIMVIAVSMAVTACGGGTDSSKSEKAEIAAELEKELSADDKAAIKEAQAELKGETGTETEADSDNPWTNGMLEKFGCADMPRPNENYPIKDVQFKELKSYDKSNGNKIDNGYEISITYAQNPKIYEDYIKQLEEYLKSKDLYLVYLKRGDTKPILIHGNIAGKNKGDLPNNSYSGAKFKYDNHWVSVYYWMGESVRGNGKFDQGITLRMKYDDDDEINSKEIKEVDENGDIID